MAYLSSFSIVLFLAFIFSSWFFRSAPVRQCLYNLHVLALKLILMHTACRVSWTCFGSHLFHLCSRGHFWVKVYYDVKGNRRFLPPPPPHQKGSWIHVVFLSTDLHLLKKVTGEGCTVFKYSAWSESFVDFFWQGSFAFMCRGRSDWK